MTSNNKLTTSFKHAFAGILHVVRTQRNARIHLLITAAVVVIGACVGLSLPEWAILALTVHQFRFLPWTQLSIGGSAIVAGVVGAMVFSRIEGGLCRRALLANNIAAQMVFLLAYMANRG